MYKSFQLTYKQFGAKAILIEWPAKMSKDILDDIIAFRNALEENGFDKSITGYHSLTLLFKNEIQDFETINDQLKSIYFQRSTTEGSVKNIWEIPVCYDVRFGFDLEEISKAKQISIQEIIDIHTSPKYLVFFIGFQPGFPYLGGLNAKIHMPRKHTPRLKVPKGTVAIGGEQTGVYPQDSPGGWHAIGKTPIIFFDVLRSKPTFIQSGDYIKFKSITIEEYLRLEEEILSGRFEVKNLTHA